MFASIQLFEVELLGNSTFQLLNHFLLFPSTFKIISNPNNNLSFIYKFPPVEIKLKFYLQMSFQDFCKLPYKVQIWHPCT